MRRTISIFLLFLVSCTLPEEKKIQAALDHPDSSSLQASDSNTAARDSSVQLTLRPVQKIKKPSGIYLTTLPFNGKMEQTIAFYKDYSYRLQERYIGKRDSTVITTGNWSPSDGYIWIYQDQVVRGRYSWAGDTLQYFSPLMKKKFPMQRLNDMGSTTSVQGEPRQGLVLSATGSDKPYWSLELNKNDTLRFSFSNWAEPLVLKYDHANNSADSSYYEAGNDSVQLRIMIFPFFCSNGSNAIYRNKIRLLYNKQVLTGCGVVY